MYVQSYQMKQSQATSERDWKLRSSYSNNQFVQTTDRNASVRRLPSGTAVEEQIETRQNERLFGELEAIFEKNKVWMQQQKDRETVIKNLADQYQEKMLHHNSTSHMSMLSRQRKMDTQRTEEQLARDDSGVSLELERIRLRHKQIVNQREEVSFS